MRKRGEDSEDNAGDFDRSLVRGHLNTTASSSSTLSPPSYDNVPSGLASDGRKTSIGRQLVAQDGEVLPADQDPLGLNVLYRPSGDPKADVIFVHGLGGSSRMTWSKNHDLDYFWPKNFLPNEPELNESRILSFGYDANFRPGKGKNKMSILDFAKDLLYGMKYGQDELAPENRYLNIGSVSMISICDPCCRD